MSFENADNKRCDNFISDRIVSGIPYVAHRWWCKLMSFVDFYRKIVRIFGTFSVLRSAPFVDVQAHKWENEKFASIFTLQRRHSSREHRILATEMASGKNETSAAKKA